MIKTIGKRITVILLVVAMIFNTVQTTGLSEIIGIIQTVCAKTYTQNLGGSNTFSSKSGSGSVSLTQLKSGFSIAILNRPASKSLWKMTVSGHRVFCTNGDKHLCTGDKVRYSASRATTYGNKSIAKAITYYYYKLGGNADTKTQGMVQAYIWACGKGKSKQTAVEQAAAHFGGSASSSASALISAINATDPEGYIITCRVTSCGSGKSKSAHQVLLGWYGHDSYETKEYQKSATVKYQTSFTGTIYKKTTSGNLITSGSAKFKVTADGSSENVTTTNGKATYTIKGKTRTKTVKSKKYEYCKSWKTMSASQRKDADKKGLYHSKADAKKAAKKELNTKKAAALKTLKSSQYTVKAKETSAPTGFRIASTSSQSKKVKSEQKNVSFTFTDSTEYGYIAVNKTDKSTGKSVTGTALYNIYANESIYDYSTGAKIEKYAKGDLVESITVKNGKGTSKKLLPGNYLVKEKSSPEGYAIDATQYPATVTDNKTTTVHSEEEEAQLSGSDIMITKTKGTSTSSEPEEGAVFYAVNANAGNVNTLKNYNSEQRMAFVNELDESDVMAIIVTGEDGVGKASLTTSEDATPFFILLQVSGEDGYALAAPILSSSMTMTSETSDGEILYHYNYSILNESNASYLYIQKKMATDDGADAAEVGAEFEIQDEMGEVLYTLTTGSDGTSQKVRLSPGTYNIHQTKGAEGHDLIDDEKVTFTEDDAKKYGTEATAYVFSKVDGAEPPNLRLRKVSSETGNPVDGAIYTVMDSKGNNLGEFITGADGTDGEFSIALDGYGTYYVKETTSPSGFVLDTKTHQITVDSGSVVKETTTNEDGEEESAYVYQCELSDKPVYGDIAINKTGNVVTGYSTDGEGFEFEEQALSGAVYALYAREDITKDDGTVVWSAGTKIATLTTSSTESVKFINPKAVDGMEKTDFWLGEYYVKEVTAPTGYVLDTEEHEIVLSDTIQEADDVAATTITDVEDPVGNNGVKETTGPYVLETGEKLNARIKDATTVSFVQTTAPSGVAKVDVSHDGDGTVVLWKSGTNYYISSQNTSKLIYLNAQSSHMFEGCNSLENVNFDAANSIYAVDMSYMFADCWVLQELDLAPLDTRRVQDVSYMFKNDRSLVSIYVFDTDLLETDDDNEPNPVYITATPNNVFELKDDDLEDDAAVSFTVDDFTFNMHYDDNTEEEIDDITADMVTFTKASPEDYGAGTYNIRIDISGKYADYSHDSNATSGGVHTDVVIIDPNGATTDTQVENVHYVEDIRDELQTVTIKAVKKDASSGETLGGAVIGLYAAASIKDHAGNVLFKTGDLISKVETSTESNFDGIEFNNLPANTGSGNLYYIQEITPPVGYKTNTAKFYFSGTSTDNTSAEISYEPVKITDEKQTYVSLYKYWDADDIANGKAVAVKVNILKDDAVVATVTLSEENNWREVFDGTGQSGLTIKPAEVKESIYEFDEITDTGNSTSSEMSSSYDTQSYVYTISNKADTTRRSIKKTFDDDNNMDGIRPTSVQVNLVGDDTNVYGTLMLSDNNEWFGVLDSLPTGITYHWEEVSTTPSVILGNQLDGYKAVSKTDTSNPVLTHMTNVHKKTTEQTVKKVWQDDNDKDKLRPSSVKVNLLANDKAAVDISGNTIPTIELSSANNWTYTVKDLPMTNDDGDIAYTWQEVSVAGDDDAVENTGDDEGAEDSETIEAAADDEDETSAEVTERYSDTTILCYDDPAFPITGESKVGYSYETQVSETDDTYTSLINTHEGHDLGKVTIGKKVRGDIILNTGIYPTFTFTLQGTTVYGKTVSPITKTVTFDKATVEKLQKALVEDEEESYSDYIELSVTFDDLEYGEYYVTESGMEGYYYLSDIVDVEGGESSSDCDEAKFFVCTDTPECSGVFVNDTYTGSLNLKKYGKDGTSALNNVEYTIESPYGEKYKGITGKGIVGYYENGTYVPYDEDTYAEMQEYNGEVSGGEIKLNYLTPGTYTVTEVKTQKGLSLLSEPFTVQIPVVMSSRAAATNKADLSKAKYDEKTGTYYFYDLTYEITDRATLSLPQTGGWMQYIPLALALTMIFAGLWQMTKKKKLVQ